MWGWSLWKGMTSSCSAWKGIWEVTCRGECLFIYFSSSPDEPLKWQFVDQFVSETGVRNIYHFLTFYFWIQTCMPLWKIYLIFYFYLWCHRRKKTALQVWRPLEAKKSRRRRFFSAWWAPRVWESASAVARPRNLVSTSVTSSQGLFLPKSDLRWLLGISWAPL